MGSFVFFIYLDNNTTEEGENNYDKVFCKTHRNPFCNKMWNLRAKWAINNISSPPSLTHYYLSRAQLQLNKTIFPNALQ